MVGLKTATRYGLGHHVNLKPVNSTNTKNKKKTGDRLIKITEETWEKLRDFSSHYHDIPASYDDLFQELVDFYNKQHEIKYFI